MVLAARVLGEFGDDPHRYTDAKARKNYAGTAPITRASGKKKIVLARYARNRRLGDALRQWAFCSLRGSPGARAYCQQLRARGIGHQAALRQLANRLVGILHGCLKTRTPTTNTPPGVTTTPAPLDTEKPGMSAAERAGADDAVSGHQVESVVDGAPAKVRLSPATARPGNPARPLLDGRLMGA